MFFQKNLKSFFFFKKKKKTVFYSSNERKPGKKMASKRPFLVKGRADRSE